MEVAAVIITVMCAVSWGTCSGLAKFYNATGENGTEGAAKVLSVFFAISTLILTIVLLNIVT